MSGSKLPVGRRLLQAMGLATREKPSVPPDTRVYAIGDLHGCAMLLDELHERIAKDAAASPFAKHIVYLGDFIDRGPDSRGVIERVLHRVPDGFAPHYIRGNHDVTLLAFLEEPENYRVWRSFGGAETLLSYGVRPPLYDLPDQMAQARDALRAALPDEHLRFLKSLELMLAIGDYLFVHAGVRPGVPIEKQAEQDLLWIREDFLGSTAWPGKMVVHGHTPQEQPVRAQNRISIDTGAYATGILTCAVLEGTDCRFIQTGVC